MATWESLRGYVKTNYKVTRDDLEFMTLLFTFDDDRSQLVVVSKMMLGSAEWVEIATAVCKEADISPRDALTRSGAMVCGGLVLRDDTIFFRHSLPLKDLDVDEFEIPFQVAVGFGDKLEQELTKGLDRF